MPPEPCPPIMPGPICAHAPVEKSAAALFSTGAWAQMGPGMMGGHGSGGMGSGMMGSGMMPGYGSYSGIKLNDEQRAKIAEIQQEVSRKQSHLMGRMPEKRTHV